MVTFSNYVVSKFDINSGQLIKVYQDNGHAQECNQLDYDGKYFMIGEAAGGNIGYYQIQGTDLVHIRDISPQAGQIRGVCFDGKNIVTTLLNAGSYRVRFSDVEGNNQVTYIVTTSILNGVTYDGKYYWLRDNSGKRFFSATFPDNTTHRGFTTNNDENGLTWTGKYFLSRDLTNTCIRVRDYYGNSIKTIAVSVASNNTAEWGVAWDGKYAYILSNSSLSANATP